MGFRTLLASSVTAIAAILLNAVPTVAQAPAIGSLSTQAVAPGGTVDLTIRGSNLAANPRLWTSFAAQSAIVPDKPASAGEATFRLTADKQVSPGVYGLRVVTDGGVSPLRLFLVDDLPSVPRQGGNTSPSAAQAVALPAAVDAVMEPLTLHFYRISAQAGQRVSIEVFARRIGSALDPMIRLLDVGGHELAYADDSPGLSADCHLTHTFAKAGDYIVEVRDIRYQGGGNHFYRLRMGDFPRVTTPFPLAVTRGTSVPVAFAGPDTADVQPLPFTPPENSQADWVYVAARRKDGRSSGMVQLQISDWPEHVESEPNNEPAQGNRIEPNAGVSGRFEKPGDVDCYVIPAKKGQRIRISGITRRQGAPTDLSLKLRDASGKQVAAADDSGTSDGVIEYGVPADGDYTLVVEELTRRGGPEYAYRVAIELAKPGFELAATVAEVNVPNNAAAAITVNATRRGYNGPIELSVEGLPEGLKATPTVIGPGQNSVVLTLEGAAGVAPGTLADCRIVGSGRIGNEEVQAVASVAEALKARLAQMPWPPRSLIRSLAVAATPPAALALKADPGEVVFGRQLTGTVTIRAQRGEGIDEQITLAVTPAKNGLPPGITPSLKPIPKGANEIQVSFAANEKAPLGEFTVALVATHKKGNATVTQVVPGIRLKLEPPLSVAVQSPPAKLVRGQSAVFKVTVHRNPALPGDIKLNVDGLPQGVTAAEVVLPAGSASADVALTAAADAKPGKLEGLRIKATTTAGKATFTAQSPPLTLVIE